jgi:hypothetical protein
VVGLLNGCLGSNDYASPIGLQMNDEKVRFKTNITGNNEIIDKKNCEIYKKWHSFGQHQILNDLGNEGWELIKSSGPYLFKRPLKET